MAPTEAFHDLEFAMLETNEGKVVSSIEALQKDSIHSGEYCLKTYVFVLLKFGTFQL